MKRREFITLLGSSAVAWPLAARAQQDGRVRRVGVLMTTATDDPEGQARLAAFLQGLQQLGWIDGRNARIDTRWAAGNSDYTRRYAAELLTLAPDVILAAGSQSVGPLLQATRTVPIVFVHVPDPVGAGTVDSLARPGQCHRFQLVRIRHERQMAGTAQRGRTGCDASGSHSGFRHNGRDRPVGLNPVDGAVAQRRGNSGKHARCGRDRARRHSIRARGEWRSDLDGKRVGVRSL